MMKYDHNTLRQIYDKTRGRCHLCRKNLSFSNYGSQGRRGAWEVEHSVPRARGGSEHLNNLYAACISCNRSKGSFGTRAARAANGYRCAPHSEPQKRQNALKYAGIGSLAALLVPPQLRVVTALLGIAVGAAVGYDREPD